MDQYVRKIPGFTADTGRVLDWQIGFEDNMPQLGWYHKRGNYYGFLGIGEGGKKEDKKRDQALAETRTKIPPPTSCDDARLKLALVQREIVLQQNLANGIANSSKSILQNEGGWAPRFLYALSIIQPEIVNYINTKCSIVTTNPSAPAGAQTSAPATGTGPSAGTDPLLNSALPSNTLPTGTTATPGINPAPASSGSTTLDEMKTGVKKLPSWALWAGGGVLALVIGLAIFKKKA